MSSNISASFQDKMGLQWTIELCEVSPSAAYEDLRSAICELRDRVAKSDSLEPDGQRVDAGSNSLGSGGNIESRVESRPEPAVGIPRRRRGRPKGSRKVPKRIRPSARTEDHPASDPIPRDTTLQESDRDGVDSGTGGLLREETQ